MRGNGFKLKECNLILDIRKEVFTVGVVRHYNLLPRAVAVSSLAVFKVRMNGALINLAY